MNSFLLKIEKLISQGEIREAIEELIKSNTQGYNSQLLGLSAQLYRVKAKELNNTIGMSEFYIEMNKITYSLLAIVQKLKSQDGSVKSEESTVKDNQGNIYKTVELAGRTWLGENLKCYVPESFIYDENPKNLEKNGRLYNWRGAIEASQCLDGNWKLPTLEEWKILAHSFGGIGYNSKGRMAYQALIKGGKSKFEAIPSGKKYYRRKNYDYKGIHCFYWSGTSKNRKDSRYIYFDGISKTINTLCESNQLALSVRCIKQ